MAYTAGDKILIDQYNTFLNGTTAGNFGINHIIGTGDGKRGMGQTTLLRDADPVAVGQKITAAQWNALFTAMDNVSNHSNTATVAATNPRTAGEIIAVVSTLNTQLQALATTVQDGCQLTTALTLGTATSSVASAQWDTQHEAEYSFTFAGGDAARHFFNAGGKLRVTFSNAATGSTGLDTVVTGLMNDISAFDMGSTVSTITGSTATDTVTTDGFALGYYDLTTSYQTLLHYTESSGTYDYSYQGLVSIKFEAKVSSPHGDGRNNNGNVITLKVTIANADAGFTKGGNFTVIAGKIDYDGKYAAIKANSCGPTTISFNTRTPNNTEGLTQNLTAPTIAKVAANIQNDNYVRGGSPGTIVTTAL
jgi:hypothetical protein